MHRWVVFSLFFSSAVQAAGFDSLHFRPALSDANLLSVWSTTTLPQYDVWAGTFLTHQSNSFQIVRSGSTTEVILEKSLIQHLGLGVCMKERWMELSIDIPIGWSVGFTNPNVNGSTRENQINSGDTRIYWRANLMSQKQGLGLAVIPFLQIPTGSDEEYMGTASVAGGFLISTDASFGPHFSTAFNLGLYTQKKFEFRDIVIEDQILYGLGAQYLLVPEVAMSIEFFGRSKLTSPFNNTRDNPSELLGNIRFFPPFKGMKIDFGGGIGVVSGTGAPEYRLLIGLQYRT